MDDSGLSPLVRVEVQRGLRGRVWFVLLLAVAAIWVAPPASGIGPIGQCLKEGAPGQFWTFGRLASDQKLYCQSRATVSADGASYAVTNGGCLIGHGYLFLQLEEYRTTGPMTVIRSIDLTAGTYYGGKPIRSDGVYRGTYPGSGVAVLFDYPTKDGSLEGSGLQIVSGSPTYLRLSDHLTTGLVRVQVSNGTTLSIAFRCRA